jgi:hypothetical protein
MLSPTMNERRNGGRHLPSESGVAGSETLFVSALIFVGGTLLLINLWAVLDARMTAGVLARHGSRTAADEIRRSDEVLALARRAVDESALGLGRRDAVGVEATVDGRSGDNLRCAPVTVVVTLTVPAVRLPFGLRDLGTKVVRAQHTERVDPYRSGLEGDIAC